MAEIRQTFSRVIQEADVFTAADALEGGETKLMPDGKQMRVFEAAEEYLRRDVPLAVIAGKNYGCGSSRGRGCRLLAPWRHPAAGVA